MTVTKYLVVSQGYGVLSKSPQPATSLPILFVCLLGLNPRPHLLFRHPRTHLGVGVGVGGGATPGSLVPYLKYSFKTKTNGKIAIF